VIQLLEVHAKGAGQNFGADLNNLPAIAAVELPAGFAAALVGVDYTDDETVAALEAIGCVVARVEGGFEIIPPSWRPDLRHKTDLVEEVARINGYDRIPASLPVAPPGRGLTKRQKSRRAVLTALVGNSMTEVLNYPFLSQAENRWFASDSTTAVRLANAMQEESSELRLSLLPALIQATARNLSRGITDLALFEEGSVFLPDGQVAKTADLPSGITKPTAGQLAELEATIPDQPRHLAGLLVGNRVQTQVGVAAVEYDYSDAIHAARLVARAVGLELNTRQASPKGYHPGRTAELVVHTGDNIAVIGFAGELDPALAIDNNLPRRVAAFEINLEKLYAVVPDVITATPIYNYPAATQDLSLVVDATLPAAEVLSVIRVGAGELLEQVRLIDDYRGQNVADGKKSLTFALRFRANDRTLTQAEATAAKDDAVALAKEKFGAELRA
jgi:phenylalanyl-tRNA synthetase beta chain